MTALSYPYTDLVTKAYAECPQIHLRDTRNMMEINLRPDLNPRVDCVSYDFRPKQHEGIDSNCLLQSLITNLTYLLLNSEQLIRSKYGFHNRTDLRKQVIDLINQKCGQKNPTLVLGMSKITVPICTPRVNQGGTDMTVCMINFLQQLIIQIENDPQQKFNMSKLHVPYVILCLFFIIVVYLIF